MHAILLTLPPSLGIVVKVRDGGSRTCSRRWVSRSHCERFDRDPSVARVAWEATAGCCSVGPAILSVSSGPNDSNRKSGSAIAGFAYCTKLAGTAVAWCLWNSGRFPRTMGALFPLANSPGARLCALGRPSSARKAIKPCVAREVGGIRLSRLCKLVEIPITVAGTAEIAAKPLRGAEAHSEVQYSGTDALRASRLSYSMRPFPS